MIILYFFRALKPKTKMPASKKTLKKQEQKKNQAAGIGDEKGRIPSRVKV